MKQIEFTNKEQEKLRLIQKQTKDKRIYRKVTILLGLNDGISVAQLSRILGIDESTIKRYKKKYLECGLEKFLQDKYKSYWGKLNSRQIAMLVNELKNNIYTTTAQISDWIENQFRIKYHTQGLVHLLKKLGFVYKKTKLIPSKADAHAQEKFVEEYNEQQKNLGNDEVIYFGDGVHPQHNTQVSNAWIFKGEEKEIKSNTGRTRLNINGVINPNEPTDVIVGEYKTINTDTTIEFFKEIERRNPKKKKIIIYVDNARYYKNKKVEEYLKNSRVRLIFLPVYSPNLNLIERLWKFMKKIVTNNKYYEKSTEFRRKLLLFFKDIYIYKKELESLITNKFHIINAQ